jgi:hypothetical protein
MVRDRAPIRFFIAIFAANNRSTSTQIAPFFPPGEMIRHAKCFGFVAVS